MDRTFPLGQAADAHRRMEAGDHVGKIVLTVEEPIDGMISHADDPRLPL